MKSKFSIYVALMFLFIFTSVAISQIKIQEGFETTDTLHVPTGWSRCFATTYPVLHGDTSNWTVRDSGVSMPGLSTALTQAHLSLKSCGVSWNTGVDTNGTSYVSDAWLVTKQIPSIATTDVLKFWISGGTPTWVDSVQVWVNFIDSLPGNFTNKLGSIIMTGLPYGTWTQHTYSLSGFAGLPIYIGFRYITDCVNQGFAVYLDDVFVGNPDAINHIGTGVPTKYALGQNYPNPFNPVTTIKFDLPKTENVMIIIYDITGKQIDILSNENFKAGRYQLTWNASNYASGVYFYGVEAGDFKDTKKMILLK